MEESVALADKLRVEGDKMASFLASLGAADWNTEVYTEGRPWTVRSILAHLATTEASFLPLFERIRRGGPGVSEDFSIDDFNAQQQARTKDLMPPALLETYRSTRGEMIELVRELSAEELTKRGRHPFLGVTTLLEMVRLIYIHNQTHYRDIRRALKGSR